MQIRTDDEMYRVDRTFLGPKGRRFPWRATYRAYGLWFVLVVLLGGAMLKLGVDINLTSVVLLLAASVLGTQRLMKGINHDRPFLAVAAMCAHEVAAPRPLTRRDRPEEYLVTTRASRWRAGAEPKRRLRDRFRRSTTDATEVQR